MRSALGIIAISILLLGPLYLLGWKNLPTFWDFIVTRYPRWGQPAPYARTVDFPDSKIKISVPKHIMEIGPVTSDTGDSHLIVAGDSNVFGWNLPVEERLVSYLELGGLRNKFQIRGFSSPGWGPSHILERFKELPEGNLGLSPKGHFILNLLDIHLERVCGSKSYFLWGSGLGPEYRLDDVGRIDYQGLFNSAWEFHAFIFENGFKKILNLFIPQRYDIDLSLVSNPDCLGILRGVVVEMNKQYKSRFPQGQFTVVLSAYWMKSDRKFIETISKLLKSERIDVREIDTFLESEVKRTNLTQKDLFQSDLHFAGKLNLLYAKFYELILLEDGEHAP